MSESRTDADKAVLTVVADCYQIALGDEFWRLFGFAKRPRHGSLFQRLRAKWRVELEKTLLREMTAAAMAVHIVAGVLTDREIPQLVEVCAGSEARPTFACFGYSSRREFVVYFEQSIADYVQMGMDAWTQRFLERLSVHDISDKELSAKLTVGSARFAVALQHTVKMLRLQRQRVHEHE